MKIIYFDNAATTKYKPEEVYEAFNYYLKEVGTSPGRGSYQLGIDASRMLYKSRKTVADFFGKIDPNQVVFTKNSTEAINFFLNGYLNEGDHVLLSPYEHNAVLRPIHNLSLTRGITYSILDEETIYEPSISRLKSYINANTKLAAISLASNLTGQIVFNRELAEILQGLGIKVLVDASQGGGKYLLDMNKDNVDFLAFTGHKDFHGLPGVGGLCSKNKLEIPPLIQGGTGIMGDSYTNPASYPDAYEAGTLNMPAIWAFNAAVDYINKNREAIATKEAQLIKRLISGLENLNNVFIYKKNYNRVPTISINIKGYHSNEIVEILDSNGICVRGGVHCSILAHKTIGTENIGAVRLSIDHFNNQNEIDDFLEVLKRIR